MSRRTGKAVWLLVVLLLVGGWAWTAPPAGAGSGKAFWKEGTGNEAVRFDDGLRTFIRLSRELAPTVVNISSTRVMKQHPAAPGFGNPHGEEEDRNFFERYFRKRRPEQFHLSSLGSGFIIHEDGYIVTNNHVIEETEDIRVTLADEREFEAEVVGRDPKTDLALLRIPAEDLPVVTFGDSDQLEIGEWVLAIGNPFGLDHSVTAGIVSAKGRHIGSGPYDDFIQTDASINPGNSGGPLFNTQGEVIGINTAIISSGTGIGFAIPINLAKELLPQLLNEGRVTRGWLGVTIQDMNEELAESFGLEGVRGVLVSRVVPNDPADKAGIRDGDIILTFDGREIGDVRDLQQAVARARVGKKVEVRLHRKGKEKKVWVTVGKMEDEVEVASAEPHAGDGLGMTIEEVDKKLAEMLGIPRGRGVAVTQVKPGAAADRAGIRAGDIILEIDRHAIGGPSDYRERIERGSSTLLFLVQRGEATLFAAVKKE